MNKENFQSIRGMRDLTADDAIAMEYLMDAVRKQLASYGYRAFHPPILESTELFSRSIGEGTDVVEKEMFSFDDHGDNLTMRPEATAGMARAVIQNGMTFGVHKLWTAGPMFRRERPQKGRYRQFHQVSVEVFGVAQPEQDAEQILFAAHLWKKIGVHEHVKLIINTLATPVVRKNYREALISYFEKHKDKLDEDSQRRLAINPLRILDSKNPDMKKLIDSSPKLSEYRDEVSENHFNRVLTCLDNAGITYHIDETLVRGLDYYNHTVYEWVTDKLGSQGTICGGGRYDGLTELIGGKPTPAVGFGLGLDRTVLLMQTIESLPKAKSPLAYFVLHGAEAVCSGLIIANKLRTVNENREIITNLSGVGIKSQFKKADQSGAEFAVIIAENELQGNNAIVKNLYNGEQTQVLFEDLVEYFTPKKTLKEK